MHNIYPQTTQAPFLGKDPEPPEDRESLPRFPSNSDQWFLPISPLPPPFYHIDLYRIGAGNDLESTGIWDCLGRNSVSVIEWAEKLGNAEIGGFIRVFIEDAGNDRREVTIEGIDEENRDNL